MQYVQIPYTEWVKPNTYDPFNWNGFYHHYPPLSSNTSSLTDGSSAYSSSTNYQYDLLPSAIGRLSSDIQQQPTYEVLLIKLF